MAGRINAGIYRVNEKLKEVPIEKQEEIHKTLEQSFNDLIACQELQSYGFASGILSLEEAQELYRIYGGDVPSPEKWDKLSLAEKVIGTQICAELAQKRSRL